MIGVGVVMGVGVGGGGSEILDQVDDDDDDDDDGLPRTKKSGAPKRPAPLEPALGDQFDVRRKLGFLATV